MSKDISTMYTKDRNKTKGRRGFAGWQAEKEDVITPKDYGQFIQNKKRK